MFTWNCVFCSSSPCNIWSYFGIDINIQPNTQGEVCVLCCNFSVQFLRLTFFEPILFMLMLNWFIDRFETQHGALCAIGYITADYMSRAPPVSFILLHIVLISSLIRLHITLQLCTSLGWDQLMQLWDLIYLFIYLCFQYAQGFMSRVVAILILNNLPFEKMYFVHKNY
jgi:hypothetical protein